jgi:hypothetical protein
MKPEELEELLAQLDEPPPETPMDIVNGAMRANDGTFWQQPGRTFLADGREPVPRDRLVVLCDRTATLLALVRDGDTVYALAAAKALRRYLDLLEHEMIAIARGQCWSWKTIGQVMSVHPSTLHRRFAQEEVPPRQRRREPRSASDQLARLDDAGGR